MIYNFAAIHINPYLLIVRAVSDGIFQKVFTFKLIDPKEFSIAICLTLWHDFWIVEIN